MRLPWRPVSPLPAASTDLRYTMTAMTAVMNSVIQNAFQTPTGPMARHKKAAAGIMMNRYRNSEMMRDRVPFPSPSNAPEDVTETADTIKPALMMRRAVCPARIVSGLSVNSPISCPADVRHATVPKSIMIPLIHSAKIITDKGAHSLDNPIGREIKERL